MSKQLIRINKNQAKNPLLQCLHPNSYIYSDTHATPNDGFVEDFSPNPNTAILFLQFKFHLHKPLYIKQRFEEVQKFRNLCSKYLILIFDDVDDKGQLTELEILCLQYETKLIIAWSL